ncbi:MAG: hypothetical protein NXI31_00915 [bacterium]|nr:hypothetical protein [bacterium]
MTTRSVISSAIPLVFSLTCAAQGEPGQPPRQEPQSLQEQIREMAERIDELEEMQMETSDRLGSRAVVQSYTAQNLDIGGHISSFFSYIDGANGRELGHTVTLFELYIKARINEEWSAFVTPGMFVFNGGLLDDPATPTVANDPGFTGDNASNNRTLLARGYVEYNPSDLLRIQGGIVGGPHGTTSREYFVPARSIGLGSLHTRRFLANSLYPGHFIGFRASGKIELGGTQDWLEYDGYFGSDDEQVEDPLGGVRLAYVFGDYGLSIAGNFGTGSRAGLQGQATSTVDILSNVPLNLSPFPLVFNAGRDYEFAGIDIDWRHGDFICKTEAYISWEDGFDDQRAFSTEWTWFPTSRVGLSYRFDYYDPGSDMRVVSAAPFTLMSLPFGHSTEHAIGITYDPDPSVRLRLDLHHNNLPNSSSSVDFINFNWSLSF